MICYYKKNKDAGKNNGGYAKMNEVIDTLVIEKNNVQIELSGEEAMRIYNLIKPISAPTYVREYGDSSGDAPDFLTVLNNN
jgi:hypothetical protein